MSNLSDLLPSGGSAGKTLTATASANITLGQTVALNANGTVQGGVGTSTTVVIGTDYFVATDGSIATTGTVKLGRAITTSQILMTG